MVERRVQIKVLSVNHLSLVALVHGDLDMRVVFGNPRNKRQKVWRETMLVGRVLVVEKFTKTGTLGGAGVFADHFKGDRLRQTTKGS